MNSLISANLIHRTLNFFKNKDFVFLDAPLLVDKDIVTLTSPTVKKAKRHRDQYNIFFIFKISFVINEDD